jgi:hypothetical protein
MATILNEREVCDGYNITVEIARENFTIHCLNRPTDEQRKELISMFEDRKLNEVAEQQRVEPEKSVDTGSFELDAIVAAKNLQQAHEKCAELLGKWNSKEYPREKYHELNSFMDKVPVLVDYFREQSVSLDVDVSADVEVK